MSEKVKAKKPFYKKWWVWLIAIILLIAIVNPSEDTAEEDTLDDSKKVAASEPSEQGKTEKEKAKDEQEKEKPKKDESKKKEEPKPSYKIGDTVTVGKMIYRINEKSVASQVGPSILPQKASGQYVVIDVTLKNDGNEAVTIDSSFFKLKRGEKTYEADTMGSMSANQGNDGNINNSFFLQSLNPDSEISGKVVFDVASEVAESSELQLQVQTGFWGTETEVIDLK